MLQPSAANKENEKSAIHYSQTLSTPSLDRQLWCEGRFFGLPHCRMRCSQRKKLVNASSCISELKELLRVTTRMFDALFCLASKQRFPWRFEPQPKTATGKIAAFRALPHGGAVGRDSVDQTRKPICLAVRTERRIQRRTRAQF